MSFKLLFKWLIFRCPSLYNNFPAGGCVSKTAPTIVKKNCDGKSSCVLVASNFALGGDPCVGTHKYLTVTWGCGNVLIKILTIIITSEANISFSTKTESSKQILY